MKITNEARGIPPALIANLGGDSGAPEGTTPPPDCCAIDPEAIDRAHDTGNIQVYDEGGGGPGAFVQSASFGTGLAGTTWSASWDSAPTEGNTLVLTLSTSPGSDAAPDDGRWSLIYDSDSPSPSTARLRVYMRTAEAGEDTTEDFSDPSDLSRRVTVTLHEFEGEFVEMDVLTDATLGTTLAVPSITPTAGSEVSLLVVQVVGHAQTLSSGPAGYTILENVVGNSGGSSNRAVSWYQDVASASGSYSGTVTYAAGVKGTSLQFLFGITDPHWVPGGDAIIDDDDATYYEATVANIARVDLGDAFPITGVRLLVGPATSGSKTYTITADDDPAFPSPTTVATLTGTAAGSYATLDLSAVFAPASYAYWQLTGPDETVRIFSWELLTNAIPTDLTLDDLLDVDTTGVSDGDALVYDSGTGTWIPGTSGGSLALDDLSDVDTTGVGDGDVLAYDTGTSTWLPVTPGAGDVAYADLGWFNVKDYGAVGDNSTDDTSAIQDTIDAATAAGGGTIYFPPGIYVVGGALQDTSAFNGQLLLPDVSHSGDHLVLAFRGALRPGFHPVYGDTTPLADGLSVIRSTLTGASGTASCISGGNDTGAPSSGHGNNLEVWIDDLVCLGPDNPTFSFWNLQACQGGGIGALQISTPGAFAGSATQPTNSNAYGIKLPGQYFANSIDVGTLSVGGFYTGILDGELTTYRNIILGPLIYGIEFPATFYPTVIIRIQPTSVQRVMKGTGDHRVDVIQYVAEHSTSPAWAVTTYDADDASDHLYGFVRWFNAATGGTADHSFTKNSAANLGDQEIGSTWGGGGGGDVATDTIWDAAGDLAVGSGSDTAARLAIGNAGGRLSRINGSVQWNSRTSMPTAATGDIVYRSDLNGEWYYDGSQWLSLAAFQMPFPFSILPPLTATGVGHRLGMPGALGGSDIYLGAIIGGFYVAGGTALSGSHKWVGTVSKNNNAGSTSLGTITINSGASSQWRALPVLVIGAAAAVGSGYVSFEINWVKTGTPGDLYATPVLAYRTIAT